MNFIENKVTRNQAESLEIVLDPVECFFFPSCSSVTDRWLFPEAMSALNLVERRDLFSRRSPRSSFKLLILNLSFFLCFYSLAPTRKIIPTDSSQQVTSAVVLLGSWCCDMFRLPAGCSNLMYRNIHTFIHFSPLCNSHTVYIKNHTISLRSIDKLTDLIYSH